MSRKNANCPHCKMYQAIISHYAKRHELLLAALRIGAIERALLIADTPPDNFFTDFDFQNPIKKFEPCEGQIDFLKELDDSSKSV